MSRTCSLERVALEPRLFAKSIGIRKAEQGREGAAGTEQSLDKEESNFPVSLSLVPKQRFVNKMQIHCFSKRWEPLCPAPVMSCSLSFLLLPFLPP